MLPFIPWRLWRKTNPLLSHLQQTRFIPRCSMYGIFTYIWVIFGVNVGKYSSTMEHMGYICKSAMSSMMWCLIAMSGCIGAWNIPSLGWSSCARFYVVAVLGVSHMFWNIAGWWFGAWILWLIYWEKTYQLTFIFFRGVETTNQNMSSTIMDIFILFGIFMSLCRICHYY